MVKPQKIALAPNARKERREAILHKGLGLSFIWIFLILMYIPILVLVASSFTDTPVLGTWNGFSFKLYLDLFRDEEILRALGNTVILALSAATIATILGTCGAIGVFYSSKKWTRRLVENVTQIPVVNAEIVIALSLVVMFVFAGTYVFAGANLFSFWTLLIGHVILALPFVYLNVKPKLQQMDPALYEAALDLGCTQNQALWKATMPEIFPGIASGFLLSVTLSLDDFIVTAFTRGAGLLSGEKSIETLSTLVQAKIKKGPIPPAMRALTTLIFAAVLLTVIGLTIYRNVKARKSKTRKGREEHNHG